MKIDRHLNMVIPVFDEHDRVIYVHSTPISRASFDMNYRIIGKAWNAVYAGGFGVMAGPRIAKKLLEETARKDDIWDGPGGVENTLINEIYRLTNVIVPAKAPGGMEILPWHEALKDGWMSEDDQAEVENALVFFTLNSAMLRGKEKPILETAVKLWGAQITFSNSTEFKNSLLTLTKTANTGEDAAIDTQPAGPEPTITEPGPGGTTKAFSIPS